MPRPRNEELFHTIQQTAYHQLITFGYADTTYQSIATACGVTRTAVQNYYASKPDLALAFFGDLLTCISNVIQQHGFHQENEFDIMFCIGQSFFAFLMRDGENHKLLQDTISSREITTEVLDFEYRWGTHFLSPERSVSAEKFHDDIICAMGGFYELFYVCLKDGRTFDLASQLGRVIRAIMHDYGYSYESAKAFIAAHHMTEEELETMITAVSAEMNL